MTDWRPHVRAIQRMGPEVVREALAELVGATPEALEATRLDRPMTDLRDWRVRLPSGAVVTIPIRVVAETYEREHQERACLDSLARLFAAEPVATPTHFAKFDTPHDTYNDHDL